jgi:hypothetical protein
LVEPGAPPSGGAGSRCITKSFAEALARGLIEEAQHKRVDVPDLLALLPRLGDILRGVAPERYAQRVVWVVIDLISAVFTVAG